MVFRFVRVHLNELSMVFYFHTLGREENEEGGERKQAKKLLDAGGDKRRTLLLLLMMMEVVMATGRKEMERNSRRITEIDKTPTKVSKVRAEVSVASATHTHTTNQPTNRPTNQT